MRRSFLRNLLIIAALAAVALVLFVSCRALNQPEQVSPTAQAAKAVVLVPGFGGDAGGLKSLEQALRSQGKRVEILNIGDGKSDINAYASELVALADRYKGVDVVGYSEGGLIARAAVAQSPESFHRIATLATPHHGTILAQLAKQLAKNQCPLSCQQMSPDSEFLASLPVAGDLTRWLSVYSSSDDVVRPVDSSELQGASNLELTVGCGVAAAKHGDVPTAQASIRAVATFLDTGAANCW